LKFFLSFCQGYNIALAVMTSSNMLKSNGDSITYIHVLLQELFQTAELHPIKFLLYWKFLFIEFTESSWNSVQHVI
jgi:hypothetical protein